MHLEQPLDLVDDAGSGKKAKLAGFVQELAVRAGGEAEARAIAAEHVAKYELGPEQKIDVLILEIQEIEDGAAPPDASRVWFESGRSFYSEE